MSPIFFFARLLAANVLRRKTRGFFPRRRRRRRRWFTLVGCAVFTTDTPIALRGAHDAVSTRMTSFQSYFVA